MSARITPGQVALKENITLTFRNLEVKWITVTSAILELLLRLSLLFLLLLYNWLGMCERSYIKYMYYTSNTFLVIFVICIIYLNIYLFCYIIWINTCLRLHFSLSMFSACDAKKRLCLFNHVRKQVITNIRYSNVHVFMYDVSVPSSSRHTKQEDS